MHAKPLGHDWSLQEFQWFVDCPLHSDPFSMFDRKEVDV
jgi:hypothetical protein